MVNSREKIGLDWYLAVTALIVLLSKDQLYFESYGKVSVKYYL